MFRHTDRTPASLRESRLARVVPMRELEFLDLLGTTVRVPAGRQAMAEDAVGRECLVVIEGSFIVERNGEQIAELHAGDFMGEVALLTSRPRNATVTAAEDSTVYALSRRDFHSVLRECPAISVHVLAAADERLGAA